MADPQEVKQEQIVRLAPFQEEFLSDIFKTAKDLTGDGTQMPYSPQQLAGLSQGQQQAIQQALGGIGGFQPYLQQGSQALGQGIGAVGTGLGTIGAALSQLPEAQQAYRQQQQAMLDAQRLGQAGIGQAQEETARTAEQTGQAVGLGQAGIGQAQDLTRSAMMQSMMGQGLGQRGLGQAQQMTAGASYDFDPTSYREFMDPYMEDIVQQQYADIAEQGDIAKNRASAQAIGAGAFGGSRGAIEQAAINQNVLEQQARTGSQLRSAGFQQAQNLAQQAASRQAQQQLAQAGQYGQQAGQAGALGLQGAGQRGQLAGQFGQQAGQMGALGLQGAQQGLARAGQMGQLASQAGSLGFQGAQGYGQAAAGLGNLAQLTGQLGQTTGALGQTVGQLGTATAGLGQLGQQMGVQDVNTLLGIGGLQQGQAQKTLDIARANDLARQALPYQQVGFMSDIFRGVPALQQTYSTTTSPGTSTSSQLLGLGIAGLGAAGRAKGFSNLFG